MEIEEILKNTRKAFFAYRNGIIADTLRSNGDPHKSIMGCQLTDVAVIAQQLENNAQLAEAFWNQHSSRECRMIAPMLYPVAAFGQNTALAWCLDVESCEIADILCHRLLRKLDYAQALVKQLLGYEAQLTRYTAFRLLLNIIITGTYKPSDNLRAIAEHELTTAQGYLRPVLNSILEEI